MLSSTDRHVIGSGTQQGLIHMASIVKKVIEDPAHPGGGGGMASDITNPRYLYLFEELQRILHEIESEILKGWKIPSPVPPSA